MRFEGGPSASSAALGAARLLLVDITMMMILSKSLTCSTVRRPLKHTVTQAVAMTRKFKFKSLESLFKFQIYPMFY